VIVVAPGSKEPTRVILHPRAVPHDDQHPRNDFGCEGAKSS